MTDPRLADWIRGLTGAALAPAALALRARGAETLWLGVWERNPRATACCAKYGFARVGEHTSVPGADAQTDRLLARPLGGADPRRTAATPNAAVEPRARAGWSVWGARPRRCWTAGCSTPSTATSGHGTWRAWRR